MADKQPPSGPNRPPPGSTGPKPPGAGAGKPSPAHGVPVVGGPRPDKLSPSASPGGRSDVDRKLLLRDVMDHAVRVHKETTGPQGIGRGPSINRGALAMVICVPLLAFCVYSLVARPEFLWGPKSGPLPTVQNEANIRFAMFLLAQRIEKVRRVQGQLPASLQAVGDSVPGVTYAPVNDRVFELRASEGGKALVYRSDQPANAFLGNSFDVIQGSGK